MLTAIFCYFVVVYFLPSSLRSTSCSTPDNQKIVLEPQSIPLLFEATPESAIPSKLKTRSYPRSKARGNILQAVVVTQKHHLTPRKHKLYDACTTAKKEAARLRITVKQLKHAAVPNLKIFK